MDHTPIRTQTSQITFSRVCRACRAEPEFVLKLVEAGIIKPKGTRPVEWRFTPEEQHRAEAATYLRRRYHLNAEAVAFVMQLLDTNRTLRSRRRRRNPAPAGSRGRRAGTDTPRSPPADA
jgi:chaperone modulatory protein CbpM